MKPKRGLDLPSRLAYIYAPLLPYLKWMKITRKGPRGYNAEDILVPQGYEASVVATGFNAPVHCCFDEQGFCYVTEAGHKIEASPRIVKVNVGTGEQETFFELPQEQWNNVGAVTGSCWHQGYLYIMNTDTLLRIRPDGTTEAILTDLPGRGDHQANYPVVGPDGKLYFGIGSATNTGIVGADNFAYEWLPKFPQFHDVPAQDIRLAGPVSQREQDPCAHRRDATRAAGACAGGATRLGSGMATAYDSDPAGRFLHPWFTHATSTTITPKPDTCKRFVVYAVVSTES